MTKQKLTDEKTVHEHYSRPSISKVIEFLGMFMPITLAKRIVCIITLSIGVTIEETARISGFCEKTVASVKKKLDSNELDILFVINGGGRKSPLAEFEADIMHEITDNAYYTKQQIADMVFEKYGIRVTQQAIGKLLKKRGLNC